MEETVTPRGLDLIGNPVEGRKVLGEMVPVQLFRALRLVGVMEGMKEIAGRGANAIIYRGGRNLGLNIGKSISDQLTVPHDLNSYLSGVINTCQHLGIGLLSTAGGSFDNGKVYLQVDECVSCAGMPDVGEVVCHFEGGMIAGIIENFIHKQIRCKEIKCWGKGDGLCLFEVLI
jgi:predicted hydrocarbon binding protein